MSLLSFFGFITSYNSLQRRESGIRSLSYVKDFCRAQLDLDQYAKKHHLQRLEENKGKGDKQNV